MPELPRVLVIACGALARELLDIVRLNRMTQVTVECLPAGLHNTPKLIPEAVAERINARKSEFDQILVGYADCGTGGALDRVIEGEGVTRLPGSHCYEFYAGTAAFTALQDDDPGTFYLTDYLVKHFDRVVYRGLGIDRHPQLLSAYFGNYNRLIYLSQRADDGLIEAAKAAAAKLGLSFEHRPVGYGDLATSVTTFVAEPVLRQAPVLHSVPVLHSEHGLEPVQAVAEAI